MNEQNILNELEEALKKDPSKHHQLGDILGKSLRSEVSMQDILRNADAGDLNQQMHTFNELLDREVESCASALHHRAHMMRLRADEFDKMADSLMRARDETTHTANAIVNSTETIRDTLQEHAHIEPTKV